MLGRAADSRGIWDEIIVLWHLDNLALEVIKLTGVLFVPLTGAHVMPDGFLEKKKKMQYFRQVPAVGPFISAAKPGRGSLTCVWVKIELAGCDGSLQCHEGRRRCWMLLEGRCV